MSGVQGISTTTTDHMDVSGLEQPKKSHAQPSSDTNSVSSSDTPAQGSTGSPIDGGRETTTAKPLGHKEIEQMTEERLMEDPEYVALKDKLASCAGLEEMFHQIDKHVGWRDDDKITMDDILALVNDTNTPNKAARDAAKWLNDHREVLSALKGDDNLIGIQDVKNFLAGMKADLKGMKDAARADIKQEEGIVTKPATGTTASAATAAGKTPEEAAAAQAIMTEADESLPKPGPSQFSGLEGASENLNNMVGWAEAETDRLTKLMGKTDDPAVLKQLEAKINQMSRRMQQMTALMNQIMTAMQNISRMYSDIAMNSVRNMK